MSLFSKMTEMTIHPKELGNVPCLPPRRRFVDFLPMWLVGWTRKRWERPGQTPRENWLVQSLFLRLFYQNHLVEKAVEETPKAFFLSEASVADPDKAAKEGTVTGLKVDDDPWRWS